jgi:tRNA-(ms[2]io[6]A)-hydroxylase
VLRSTTDPLWLEVALADLDLVLRDHAHCEKKAAAQAMALVSSYPERDRLVRQLSGLAIEELRHFRRVHAELRRRGGVLGRDPGDPYARALHELARSGAEQRLNDRLLIAGLIEARSHERLSLLAKGVVEPRLASLYGGLARAEAGHAELFVELAASYAGNDPTRDRLDELSVREAEIVAALPLEPRIH